MVERCSPKKVNSAGATNNTIDIETEPSEIQFQNGSDQRVVARYSELYKEGEIENINGLTLPPEGQRASYNRRQNDLHAPELTKDQQMSSATKLYLLDK